MFTRRLRHVLWFIVALSLVTAQAQTTDAAKRGTVFDKAISTLKQMAYLPGVSEEKLDKLAADNRDRVVKAADDRAFVADVNEMFRGMGFSHIDFLSPNAAKARVAGKMVGLGVELNTAGQYPEVVYVFPGSGADRIGLKPGDTIISIDEQPYDPFRGASGPVGSTFSLKYKTADGQEHVRRVIRQEFKLEKPIQEQSLDDDTAYIRVWSFMQYSPKQMADAVEDAKHKKNLVLDLRMNTGGSVEYMRNMLSKFFPIGTNVGTFLRKDSPNNSVAVGGMHPYMGRMVLLVDGGSASASEISAAAFKEYGRAILIGRPTAGAVLSSIFMPVGEGFMLQFPIQDYKTKNGVRLEGNGVKPDVETSAASATRRALAGEPDEGIEMAMKVLKGQVKVAVKGLPTEGK